MERFLEWKFAWARFFDGFIGVITFGFVFTNFGIGSARKLARWRSKRDGLIK